MWHDFDGSGDGVYARRYDASGNPIGGPYQVNAYVTDQQQYAAVAIDDGGDFVVAWQSLGSGGTDTDGLSVQRTPAALIFADGFESGDTGAWQ